MSALCLAAAVFTGCSTWGKHDERSAAQASRDGTLTTSVKQNLSMEPVYKFTGVDVKAFGGVIQLSGFVNSEQQKQRAAEIAERTIGVDRVINSLVLKPEIPSATGRMDQTGETNRLYQNGEVNRAYQTGDTNRLRQSNP